MPMLGLLPGTGKMDDRNIVLIGFMGTGKSVVGKKLASFLKRDFIDTDAVIVEREKERIPRIFQIKGENYFRDIESQVIQEISNKKRCVIATGGGAVIRKENFKALKKNAIVICLTAEPAIVLLRTSSVDDRPLLLKSKDAIATIRYLMKEREPYYAKADYTINTSELSPDDTVKAILDIIVKEEKHAGN